MELCYAVLVNIHIYLFLKLSTVKREQSTRHVALHVLTRVAIGTRRRSVPSHVTKRAPVLRASYSMVEIASSLLSAAAPYLAEYTYL